MGKKQNLKFIGKAELNAILGEDENSRKNNIRWEGEKEIDGLLYSIWSDKGSGIMYAVQEIRTVHMGFNSNRPEKIGELTGIVEREGACKASWGVSGRTLHQMLARELKEELPQYEFEITYNYGCTVRKVIGK